MADKRSGSGKWFLIFIVLAAVMAGGGIWYFNRNGDDAPQYLTASVERGNVTQTVTATGTLNPVTNILVGCQVSGTISKIYVDYNSIVKAGQLIAELDPSIYQAQLEQAEANLANAKANLELQQVEAKRESLLFTNNLVSSSDYDTAISTLDEAEANVQLNQAQVDMARVNLGYCKIYSPVDGIVIVNNIEVGQTVAASFNTPELFQIANNLRQMQIDSSVAEADIGGVFEGQGVDFTVDAYPYLTFSGKVTQVRNSPTTVNNVVTYDCVIGVTNADYRLKPGMTANVSVIIAQRKNALLIPNGALRFHPLATPIAVTSFAPPQPARKHTIYVLTGSAPDTKLKAVNIKTGITDGIYTEVLSGLKEGDKVIVSVVYPAGSQAGNNPFGRGFPRMR